MIKLLMTLCCVSTCLCQCYLGKENAADSPGCGQSESFPCVSIEYLISSCCSGECNIHILSGVYNVTSQSILPSNYSTTSITGVSSAESILDFSYLDPGVEDVFVSATADIDISNLTLAGCSKAFIFNFDGAMIYLHGVEFANHSNCTIFKNDWVLSFTGDWSEKHCEDLVIITGQPSQTNISRMQIQDSIGSKLFGITPTDGFSEINVTIQNFIVENSVLDTFATLFNDGFLTMTNNYFANVQLASSVFVGAIKHLSIGGTYINVTSTTDEDFYLFHLDTADFDIVYTHLANSSVGILSWNNTAPASKLRFNNILLESVTFGDAIMKLNTFWNSITSSNVTIENCKVGNIVRSNSTGIEWKSTFSDQGSLELMNYTISNTTCQQDCFSLSMRTSINESNLSNITVEGGSLFLFDWILEIAETTIVSITGNSIASMQLAADTYPNTTLILNQVIYDNPSETTIFFVCETSLQIVYFTGVCYFGCNSCPQESNVFSGCSVECDPLVSYLCESITQEHESPAYDAWIISVIILSVLSCILLSVILLIAMILLIRKRQAKRRDNDSERQRLLADEENKKLQKHQRTAQLATKQLNKKNKKENMKLHRLKKQLILARNLKHCRLNEFKDLERIGAGCNGVVFRASVTLKTETIQVALKMILNLGGLATTDVRYANENEYRILDGMDEIHPNIIHFLGWFTAQPTQAIMDALDAEIIPFLLKTDSHGKQVAASAIFFILEYHPITLEERLNNLGGSITWKLIVKYAKQILSCFEFLFDNLVVHRDVKLNNVLISEPYDDIVLSDFGESVQTDEKHCCSKRHLRAGNIMYTAPEVHQQIFGPRTDIDFTKQYSWDAGCLLFEIIYREFPFPDNFHSFCGNEELTPKILPPKCRVPKEFSELIFKLIVVDPSLRMSVQDARMDLKKIEQKLLYQ